MKVNPYNAECRDTAIPRAVYYYVRRPEANREALFEKSVLQVETGDFLLNDQIAA